MAANMDASGAGAVNDADNALVYARRPTMPQNPVQQPGRLPINTQDPNGMLAAILASNGGKFPSSPNTYYGGPQGPGFNIDMGGRGGSDMAAISADPAMRAYNPDANLMPGFPKEGGISDASFNYPNSWPVTNMFRAPFYSSGK